MTPAEERSPDVATHLSGTVKAVSVCATHCFSKEERGSIRISKGQGVEGDAHCGTTVQHLSRLKSNPEAPNLRQVHVVHAELLTDLQRQGYDVGPGCIGENILTQGLPVLDLPRDAILHIGATAQLRVAGLRNPCKQLNEFCPGLMDACRPRNSDGKVERKAGIMCVAAESGEVRPGDDVRVELPRGPHVALDVV